MSHYKLKPFTEEEKEKALKAYVEKISYSARYSSVGDPYEYRHVHLPKPMVRFVPPGLLDEKTWRALGVRQSLGWEMFMRHDPEPHILLFRRLIAKLPLGVSTSHNINGSAALAELDMKLHAIVQAQQQKKNEN